MIETFRVATKDEAAAIAALVNQAYRPKTSSVAWTHEAHLIAGDRTSPDQVARAIDSEAIALLVGLAEGEIVACIQVERAESSAWIGLFAVAPNRQGGGIGKTLLARAEAHALEAWRVEKFAMYALPARAELFDFYLRRGYRPVGESFDYPLDAGVGAPLTAGLQVVVLEKAADILCQDSGPALQADDPAAPPEGHPPAV